MNKKFQSDFFGENYAEKKARRLEFSRKYYKHRLLPNLRIPTEYAFIIAIGGLISMIVVYAIGVERGKHIQIEKFAGGAALKTHVLLNKRVNATTPVEIQESKREIQKPEETTKEETAGGEEKAEKEASPSYDITGYMIQLASFRNESSAEKEVERLKRMGYNAAYNKSGTWYRVYVSGYNKMREAAKAKSELAGIYKDCYIRKID
ncbi:MAG: SPOR domain-containing protein [Candidatus Omnitrophota bacterium]